MKIVITESQHNMLLNIINESSSGAFSNLLSSAKNTLKSGWEEVSYTKIKPNQVLDVGVQRDGAGWKDIVFVAGTPKISTGKGYKIQGGKTRTTVVVSFYGALVGTKEYNNETRTTEPLMLQQGNITLYGRCGMGVNPSDLSEQETYFGDSLFSFSKNSTIDKLIRNYCSSIKQPTDPKLTDRNPNWKGTIIPKYSSYLNADTLNQRQAKRDKRYADNEKKYAAKRAKEANKGWGEKFWDAASKTWNNDVRAFKNLGGVEGAKDRLVATLKADAKKMVNWLSENFDKAMEELRKFLVGGVIGPVLSILIDLNPFGRAANTILWGVLTIYDLAKQSWVKFIFSALSFLTTGIAGKTLYKPFSAWFSKSFNSMGEALKALVNQSGIKGVIGKFATNIGNAFQRLRQTIKSAQMWLKKFDLKFLNGAFSSIEATLKKIIAYITKIFGAKSKRDVIVATNKVSNLVTPKGHIQSEIPYYNQMLRASNITRQGNTGVGGYQKIGGDIKTGLKALGYKPT